ncbi:MAG: carbamoyl phosphate synthase small subunit [Treponema sp.]|nr:carbamoyl phosphate synthase small subunit [Treponema sp.]
MSTKACLVLANGLVFEGKSFGASGCITGEAVFTTGMTGYLETLTDPSYYGQIVTQTFPLIGNYGTISPDFESAKSHLRGYIVRSWCENPSNFRCESTIDAFLKSNNIIGLYDIDTRQLTKVLRESGVMNARLIAGDSPAAQKEMAALSNPEEKQKLLKEIQAYKIEKAVESVTCNAVAIEKNADEVFKESAAYRAVPIKKDGTKLNDPDEAMKNGKGKKIVIWDFGAKANIRRELLKRGATVITMPCTATADEILAQNPDGIMLTNGPGDPADNVQIIEEIKKLCKKQLPIFGICLGHQLLALARGAKTSKLKYGHRGANQPVKHLSSGRIYISSQNHGYAVESATLPEGAVESFVNTNDNTCEGITYTDIPAFSVQFHPEASAGPLDLNFLFDDFINLINDNTYFKNFKAAYKAIDAVSYFKSTIKSHTMAHNAGSTK